MAVDRQEYFESKKSQYRGFLKGLFWVAALHLVGLAILAITLL